MKEKEMKVKELLECLFDEEQVCIGTTSGSGWIWIGTVKEMKAKLSKMDKHFQGMYAVNIDHADSEMQDLIMSLMLMKTKDDDKIKRIRMYERIKCDAYNNWKLQSYLCKWVDFKDRPAKLDWNDENGWLIVVPGIEAGTLWWKGEKKTPFDI